MRSFLVLATLLFSLGLRSLLWGQPVEVRHIQGTAHGFLVLRTLQGATIATGDLIQTVHGNEVTLGTDFHFRDGSVDDETTVFTQGTGLHLLRDHLIQRGPSFPHPVDIAIDVPNSSIVSRSRGEHHVEKVSKQHMALTPDLANGMLLILALNIPPKPGKTTLPMVVPFNGGIRTIHISFLPQGTTEFHVGGTRRAAEDFLVKIEIGGLAGLLAPILGKQPHDIHVWILEGKAPAFVREEGQLYEGGPVWQIEQVSPIL